jgi:hypothetical protein
VSDPSADPVVDEQPAPEKAKVSAYSLSNVLTQSPEKVKLWLMSVLGIVAGVRGWDPSLLETVGVGFAIERTLDLIYVAPVRTAQAINVHQAHEAAKTTEALNGIKLGQQLAAQPAAA